MTWLRALICPWREPMHAYRSLQPFNSTTLPLGTALSKRYTQVGSGVPSELLSLGQARLQDLSPGRGRHKGQHTEKNNDPGRNGQGTFFSAGHRGLA